MSAGGCYATITLQISIPFGSGPIGKDSPESEDERRWGFFAKSASPSLIERLLEKWTLFDVRLHPVDTLYATGAETGRRPIPHATNTPMTTANTNKLPAASIHSSPCVPNLLKPK